MARVFTLALLALAFTCIAVAEDTEEVVELTDVTTYVYPFAPPRGSLIHHQSRTVISTRGRVALRLFTPRLFC